MPKRVMTEELYSVISKFPAEAIEEVRKLNGLSIETITTLKEATSKRDAAMAVIRDGDVACVGSGVYYMDKEYAQAFTAKSAERAKKVVAKAEATLSRYFDISAMIPSEETESSATE